MQKAIRIVGIVGVVALILGAIITSFNVKPSNVDQVWDTAMTTGNLEASNYYIIYSDIMCPYCVAFENAIVENEEAFQSYIAEHDILVEIRVSDFLYEYGESNPIGSRYSAVATYCAKNEGKFWDYYNLAISTVWQDYFKDSGKSAFSALNKLDKSYWIELGKQIGLTDTFADCVNNDAPIAEIEANAAKTSRAAQGMPYFKFNKFTTSGFDLSWGWDEVLEYLDAGLTQ